MSAILDAANGSIDDYDRVLAELAASQKAVGELVEGLGEVRKFILAEYELPTMEAHHDGHPVEKEARHVWDKIHALIAKHGDGG